jgi:hypothetical protein
LWSAYITQLNGVRNATKKGTREMNANELADKLQSKVFCGEYGEYTDWLISDAVDMIRQQEKEIQRLKAMYEPSTKEFLGVSPDGNLLFRKAQEK